MLLRNSSTGKINIVSLLLPFLDFYLPTFSQNFKLYPGLQPTLAKKTVRFIGHEDGVPQTYNVRTKTEDQARELKEALDREIAFVKAKSDV